MRLRYRLALAAVGLAAGNAALRARSAAASRHLVAAELGLAAGWLAQRAASQPLSFPVWVHDAPWPAYPIVAQGLFGLDAQQPAPGRASRRVPDFDQLQRIARAPLTAVLRNPTPGIE